MVEEFTKEEYKRARALLELYTSEILYLQDLDTWNDDFREMVIGSAAFPPHKKEEFLADVLINTGEICGLHKEIFSDMCKIVGIEEDKVEKGFLEKKVTPGQVKSLCSAFMSRKEKMASAYVTYTKQAPKATFRIESTIKENNPFMMEVMELLDRKNKLHLGCAHFIFRPTQKIARYPTLFQAARKRGLPEEQDVLQEVIECIKGINQEVNKSVEYSTNYFDLYVLAHSIQWAGSSAGHLSTGMLQKERRLLKKEEVKVRVGNDAERSAIMVILDNAVMFLKRSESSDVIMQALYLQGEVLPIDLIDVQKGEPKVSKDAEEEERFYLNIVKTAGAASFYLVECDETQRDILFNLLTDTIREARSRFLRMEVDKMDLFNPEVMKSSETSAVFICDKPPSDPAQNDDHEGRSSHNHGQTAGDSGDKVAIREVPASERMDRELIMSNARGIEYISRSQRKVIHEGVAVRRVHYHRDLNALFFIQKKKLCVSPVSAKRDSPLASRELVSGVEDMFFGSIEGEHYMAVKRRNYLGSEELNILRLSQQEGRVSQRMHRKMYIAGQVRDLSFFGKQVVLASNDFEMINIDDLTTQELLDPLDPSIHVYVNRKDLQTVMTRKIRENTYLVAFNDMGFFIDKYGSRKKRHVLFLWQAKCTQISVLGGYIAAVAPNVVRIFTLDDGVLRGSLPIENARIVGHPDLLYLYDDRYLYAVTFSK